MAAEMGPGETLRGGGDLRTRFRLAWDKIMVALCVLALLIAVVPLGSILLEVIARGFSTFSAAFLTSLPNPPTIPGGGVGNAILGTLGVVAIATVLGVPVGVGTGIYLSEFDGNALARVVRFLTEVLSGVPSIITGVVAYGLVVVAMGTASILAGGIALAFLFVPWVTIATEEALNLVPKDTREASLALGLGKATTTLRVVLPNALGGVLTGVMLAIARVAGETAPLLWTVGNSTFWPRGLASQSATLSVTIYLYATSPFKHWQSQAWGAALLLVLLVLVTNVAARTLWARRARFIRGETHRS